MKNARTDQRRVTLRYRHDRVSGVTSLTVDVEVPEDDMPHEHRQDLKAMAEEILGVPLGSLPEGITVNLRRAGGGHAHPHPGTGHTEAEEAHAGEGRAETEEVRPTGQRVKA